MFQKRAHLDGEGGKSSSQKVEKKLSKEQRRAIEHSANPYCDSGCARTLATSSTTSSRGVLGGQDATCPSPQVLPIESLVDPWADSKWRDTQYLAHSNTHPTARGRRIISTRRRRPTVPWSYLTELGNRLSSIRNGTSPDRRFHGLPPTLPVTVVIHSNFDGALWTKFQN